jgi:WD40 repeat protein
MRPRPFLLLIAGIALALMTAGEADADKEPLWSYNTGGDWTRPLAISADGKYIASSADDKVYLFDKDSSTPLWSYTTGGEVHSVAISADGEYIVAGGSKVYLFNKDNSTPLWNYTAEDTVGTVDISADGEYIVAGTSFPDGTVCLFDNAGTLLWSYDTGMNNLDDIAISANGEYFVVRDVNEVYFFDKDSSTPLWIYSSENGVNVRTVSISVDGEYIVAGFEYDGLILFDKDSNTPLWSYESQAVMQASISANGEYIAIANYIDDWRVTLFDKDSSTPLWNYTTDDDTTNDDALRAVAISANGEYIAAGSEDNKVYFFDKDSSTPLWNYTTRNAVNYYSVDISADGEYIVAGIDDPGMVYLFEKGAPPTATIDSISPSPARFDDDVTFSGSGYDSDGTVIASEWNSDIDGVLSDEEDFNITGFSVGTHTISFRVQDNDGDWSDADSVSLYIGTAPVASASHWNDGSNESEPGERVAFRGSGSDEDGSVVKYEWDFNGDGVYEYSSSNNGNTSYTYNLEGTYTAVLRVTDNDGFTDTDSRVITVGGGGWRWNDDGGGGIPTTSLAAAAAAVAIIALRRPRKR